MSSVMNNKRECVRCNSTNWEWINDDGAIEIYKCKECNRMERCIHSTTGNRIWL